MSHPHNEMPDDPGSPDATDEANYSPNEAEAAAAEAAAADAADTDAHQPDGDISDDDKLDDELAELVDEASADEAVAAADDASAAAVETDITAGYEEKIVELTNDIKRLGAEFANYRRRVDRERQAAVTTAKAKVLGDILPVLDDLDLAKQHGHLDEGPLKTFAGKLRTILEKLGLERFGESGDEFNPDIHEAIQDNSTGEDKVLGTVLRPGYRFQTATVRNAMVIIDDPAEDTGAGEDAPPEDKASDGE